VIRFTSSDPEGFFPAVSGIFFSFAGILIKKPYDLDYFSLFKYDEGVNANTQVQELLAEVPAPFLSSRQPATHLCGANWKPGEPALQA